MNNNDVPWDGVAIINERRHGNDHYEWRLPEPMLPEHFGMLMHFLRLLETDGIEDAREYAYNRVHDVDDRLTAIQQYRQLAERDAIQPSAVDDSRRTDAEVAAYVADLVGYND